MGPVTPLLAVVEELRARSAAIDFFWIATRRGIEVPIIKKAGIEVYEISAGKWRRGLALKNIFDIGNTVRGWWQARKILKEIRPQVVVTAGGFVSVPVHLAAWTLGIPALVHQQDVTPGLANRLLAPFARRVIVSLPEERQFFSAKKTLVVGNPVRMAIGTIDHDAATEHFHLDSARATVLVFGGGGGSLVLNDVVSDMVEQVEGQFQILHITGRNRATKIIEAPYYRMYPMLVSEMAEAYAAADIVVARAGFNTLTELAVLGKPAVIVPMQHSHQEANARYFEARGAVRVLSESTLTADRLIDVVRELLTDPDIYKAMSEALTGLSMDGARERLADEVLKLVKH